MSDDIQPGPVASNPLILLFTTKFGDIIEVFDTTTIAECRTDQFRVVLTLEAARLNDIKVAAIVESMKRL